MLCITNFWVAPVVVILRLSGAFRVVSGVSTTTLFVEKLLEMSAGFVRGRSSWHSTRRLQWFLGVRVLYLEMLGFRVPSRICLCLRLGRRRRWIPDKLQALLWM